MKRSDLSTEQRNILNIYQVSTPTEKREGRQWYPMAHQFANRLSENYHQDFDRVAGVISALSPQNKWERNKQDAESILNIAEHSYAKDLNRWDFPGIYAMEKSVNKALKILSGNLEVVYYFKTSPKTRNFYLNIKDPNDTNNLTIDSHAINLWANRLLGVNELRGFFYNRRHRYDRVVEDYRIVAKYIGYSPIDLQAISWLTWRRLISTNVNN